MSELDRVTESELSHYSYLLCSLQHTSEINYDEDKESQVRALLLEFLAVRSIPDVKCTLSVNGFHVITVTSNHV
jgi:hypothetical protein